MPRGVPTAKRDEVPMRFTMFHIPPQMNQKQGGSHYIKTDEQTLWGRNRKMAKTLAGEGVQQPSEGRRGSNVVVIHPGTRFLRIGRASDVFPVTVPHVVARKSKVPAPHPIHVSSITGKVKGDDKGKEKAKPAGGENMMDVDKGHEPWDPIDPKTSPIASSLRERMLFYKMQVIPNASETCVSFNEKVEPEIIPDHSDPFKVEWIDEKSAEDVLIGENVLRLGDPQALNYVIRWPFHGGRFNAFDYLGASSQALLNDIETIWRVVLRDSLQIEAASYKDYSVVLIVPDLFERSYVRELANLLLAQMGFKQLCVQQESISATYGAGISNACVIDIGAAKTSIAIVDEGMVLSDTRISLNMGGDDITEFLLALLERVHFPYREVDLARSYDWNVMEDLKARVCSLAEGDVALGLYDFVVRRPGRATEKYVLRAYDEIILAPMCIFEPRVIEFDHKLEYMRPLWIPEVGEEIVEQVGDQITQAMIISTQHLLPPSVPVPATAAAPTPITSAPAPDPTPASASAPASAPPPATAPTTAPAPAPPRDPTPVPAPTTPSPPDTSMPSHALGRPVFAVAPQTQAGSDAPPQLGSFAGRTAPRFISLDARDFEGVSTVSAQAAGAAAGATAVPPAGGFGIDVAFEAGKLPLDVAIFNSARAAGGDEKIRKYLQAVLVVGGSARVPGMAHALESRLQAIASPLVSNMEKVQILPPPRDVDPRVLCWRGGAVLGKMDAVADLWVQRGDWDILGMRALKERSFFL